MTDDPIPRAYGRTELALAYNPGLSDSAAWRKLRSWIELNTELHQALRQAGYNPARRTFTPREVALIFEYLGTP